MPDSSPFAVRKRQVAALRLLAADATRARSYALAEAHLRAATALDPSDFLIMRSLGHVLEKQSRSREALLVYRRIISPPPNAGSTLQESAPFLFHVAELAERLGEGAVAEEAYAKILRHGKKSAGGDWPIILPVAGAQPGKARALVSVGLSIAYEHGERSRALYERAINLDPECAEAYFYLGKHLARKGEFDRAQEALDRCLVLSSGRYDLATSVYDVRQMYTKRILGYQTYNRLYPGR